MRDLVARGATARRDAVGRLRKPLALIWLLVVLVTAGDLAWRVIAGLSLQTDLLALLPRPADQPDLVRARDQVAETVTRQFSLLIGDSDPKAARAAAGEVVAALAASGLTDRVTGPLVGSPVRQLLDFYRPYRFGLLSAADRKALENDQGALLRNRALAALYGVPGPALALPWRDDPFLMLPSFLAELPLGSQRLQPDGGWLTVRDGARTYVLITARLAGNVYELAAQDRLMTVLDQTRSRIKEKWPESTVLRAGTVFFAYHGAAQAMAETSVLGLIAVAGTVLLVLGVFRRLRPLGLSLLSIAVGVMCGVDWSLWLFGELHVIGVLFGVSLVGVADDYIFHFLCAGLGDATASPWQRLRSVFPGLCLGLATSLIGYGALLLAPFTGLHQVAVLSSCGLIGAFATVVLWFPYLDQRSGTVPARLLTAAGTPWRLWESRRWRPVRVLLLIGLAAASLSGAGRLTVVDDIRRQQTLAEDLRQEQAAIQSLTGIGLDPQFFLLRGEDEQGILEAEERLIERLALLCDAGVLGGYRATAQFIPSAARQAENWILIWDHATKLRDNEALAPLLAASALAVVDPAATEASRLRGVPILTLEGARAVGQLPPWLSDLALPASAGKPSHVVTLQGITRPDLVRAGAGDDPAVTFIDPVADYTALFGHYRYQASWLLGVSVVLILALLIWRWGWAGGIQVMLPPFAALILTPPLSALVGTPFTFFSAMALVLVLGIGGDYAVFCRETEPSERNATLLAVWMAMATTLLSFGLLAFSHAFAVHAFGLTMLIGCGLAFLFAPLAGKRQATASA